MKTIDQLLKFTLREERAGKYNPNTAGSLRGAVRLFASVMTKDELAAEVFPAAKIDELIKRISAKAPQKYSAKTLTAYKSRINRLLTDYSTSTARANTLASSGLVRQRKSSSTKAIVMPETPTPKPSIAPTSKIVDVHLPLAGDRSIVMYYPVDLTETEASKIGDVLKSIAALHSER